MKLRNLFSTLALAVVTAGCASIRTSYDYDTDADFDKLSTYDWTPVEDAGLNDLVAMRVKAAVDADLSGKGYRQTSSGPDFLIAMHSVTETKVRIEDGGFRSGWGGGVGVSQYDDEALIVDILDGATKRLLWRGTASSVVDPRLTPEERTQRINETVQLALKQFPPDAPASSPSGEGGEPQK